MKVNSILYLKFSLIVLVSILLINFKTTKKYTPNQLIGKERIALYGKTYKLQKEAYLALKSMIKNAKLKGIKIHVVSAYRNFDHQNNIWKRKYDKFISQGFSSKKAVMKVKEYTAIPGTSRHHWGTDVDLSNGSYTLENKKSKSQFEKWMDENAHKYGFYRVYTSNKLRSGYKYESWHYTYRNLSKPMLAQYMQLDIQKILQKQSISGNKNFTKTFLAKYIQNNVLGINEYLY